jgi:uncharacterized metal-binding protein YceD (DUF177 family)
VRHPEFSRPQRIDTIGDAAHRVTIEADEDERAGLAARFGLIAIERLGGTFTLRRDAIGIVAEGHVDAVLTQACSVTGDPLPATVDEDVALRFVSESASSEEIELSDGDLDVVEYEGGAVDLGEAAAETMMLALDPFPRGPNAAAALKDAGVLSEEEAGPFAALSALREKLKGGGEA